MFDRIMLASSPRVW